MLSWDLVCRNSISEVTWEIQDEKTQMDESLIGLLYHRVNSIRLNWIDLSLIEQHDGVSFPGRLRAIAFWHA